MSQPASVVILVRHGQSTANQQGVLTGWCDPPLTSLGRKQAVDAGKDLHVTGVQIDAVHTSVLARSIDTASLITQPGTGRRAVVTHDWRLNERHLGALQGLPRATIIERWGNEARQRWRADPAARPPASEPDGGPHPAIGTRCRDALAREIPAPESIEDVSRRVLAYWHQRIVPDIRIGRRVLVVSHRDPIRVLVSHLDRLDMRSFAELRIEHAIPMQYAQDQVSPCPDCR